jgi:hypothetical protein
MNNISENIFSFFLSNEESFLEFNTNILETNAINLLILIGLLLYVNPIAIQPELKKRQNQISQLIENTQKDVLDANEYYSFVNKNFIKTFFWLHSWKELYKQEKRKFINNKYELVKNGLIDSFLSTEIFIKNFEKKSFLSLQRYILFFAAGRILRKFLFLSEHEQSKIIETTILKLGGEKK